MSDSPRSYELQLKHTDEEYLEYLVWHQFDVPGNAQDAINSRASGRALIVLGLVFSFLLALTLVFIFSSSKDSLIDHWQLLAMLTVIALPLVAIGWTMFVDGDRKRFEAASRRQIRAWHRNHGPDVLVFADDAIRLDETGITWISNGTTNATAWTAFTRMERKQHGVSLGSPSMWMYLPLSSLRAPGAEGAEAFLEACAAAAGLDEAGQVLKHITATRARCPMCKYELTGISKPICPECGDYLSFESFPEVFYPHKARPRSFTMTG